MKLLLQLWFLTWFQPLQFARLAATLLFRSRSATQRLQNRSKYFATVRICLSVSNFGTSDLAGAAFVRLPSSSMTSPSSWWSSSPSCTFSLDRTSSSSISLLWAASRASCLYLCRSLSPVVSASWRSLSASSLSASRFSLRSSLWASCWVAINAWRSLPVSCNF